jgi:hypothetical protein
MNSTVEKAAVKRSNERNSHSLSEFGELGSSELLVGDELVEINN